mgnify:CR=1 FL=1
MAGKKKNGKNRRDAHGVYERREARGKSSYGGNRSNERSDGSRRGGRMAVGRTIPVRYMITAVREAGRAAPCTADGGIPGRKFGAQRREKL